MYRLVEFRKFYYTATAIGLMASLAACSVKKYERSNLDIAEKYRTDQQAFVQDSSANNLAKIPYKEFFTDPVLIELIDAGVAKNNDLNVALKQIEIASLLYTQSKWGQVPTVNLNVGTAAINRPSGNSLNGTTTSMFLGQKYIEDYNSAVTIAWEADIWGKIKSRKEAALASYLQTQEAAKAVQTQLVAQIAQGYYNLLMLDTQLEITNQNLGLVDSTLNMIKVQQRLGLTTSLSVQQQENTRDQILASIPVIRQSITIQENALSVLTGEMPGAIKRGKSLTTVVTPQYNSIGIPAELLNYRPDVKSSELQVRQALASSSVARKSMYPSFSITANGGLNAYEFNHWFNVPGSLFGSVLGGITQPVLNGKRLKTQYEQSKIALEQSKLNFKQSVLNAVAEVSNSLAEIESLETQEKLLEGLVNRSGASVNTATIMFKNDLATYLDVIVAQNNKLRAELDLAAVKKQKLSASVLLYRSVGGGWK